MPEKKRGRPPSANPSAVPLVAEGLTLAGKMPEKKRGRPPSANPSAVPLASPSASNSAGSSSMVKKQVRPIEDIRYDNIGHFPSFCDNIARCKGSNCESEHKYIQCRKCKVSLPRSATILLVVREVTVSQNISIFSVENVRYPYVSLEITIVI
ncbi:AT hook motif [Popillia japonica]|uniref:AT hook motif n=1 Tax=Popillia japonica TaxID=7064 RepID=A0AAW1LT27_POPJA